MRKNKIQVGTQVKVFRRCRNWWNRGMDGIIGHEFSVSEIRACGDDTGRKTTGYTIATKEYGVVSDYIVSADCLKVVE